MNSTKDPDADDKVHISGEELDALMEKILNRLKRYTRAFNPRRIPDAQTTSIVHDAWMKMRKRGVHLNRHDANELFGVATLAVRQALADAARYWLTLTHGAKPDENGRPKILRHEEFTAAIKEANGPSNMDPESTLALNDALSELTGC